MQRKLFKITVRETGDIVETTDSLDDAVFILSIQEDTDLENGTYTPDFYEIVRDDYIVVAGRCEEEVGSFAELDEAEREAGKYETSEIRTHEVYWGDGSLVSYETVEVAE